MITAEAIEEVRLSVDNAINVIEGHMQRLVENQADMPPGDKTLGELKKATDAIATTLVKLRESSAAMLQARAEKLKDNAGK